MKLFFALSAGLIFSGCASFKSQQFSGVRFDAGQLINDSGQTLHGVKVWGELWVKTERIDLWTCKIGDLTQGDSAPFHYRMDSVDRLHLKGSCREGTFEILWP